MIMTIHQQKQPCTLGVLTAVETNKITYKCYEGFIQKLSNNLVDCATLILTLSACVIADHVDATLLM